MRKVKLPPGPVVVDVVGTALTDDDRRRIRHPAAGAVILFKRNYESPEQLAALNGVRELHIGHAIVSRAVFVGMREAVREMKSLMVRATR